MNNVVEIKLGRRFDSESLPFALLARKTALVPYPNIAIGKFSNESSHRRGCLARNTAFN